MTPEQKQSERTIDKLHRETGIPMWALETAFELSTLGMLDEETMAGLRVIPDAARIIAEKANSLLSLVESQEAGLLSDDDLVAEMNAASENLVGEWYRESQHRDELVDEIAVTLTAAHRRAEARAETSMRSACVEKVRATVLGEREVRRIGSQIVGDVLAQVGVRGSTDEREGADLVASAWVAKVVERVGEESVAALESVSIEEQKS